MQIDYSQHFNSADDLSYHLVQPYHVVVQKEAELLTKSGHATMSCDLTKRNKHGKHSA